MSLSLPPPPLFFSAVTPPLSPSVTSPPPRRLSLKRFSLFSRFSGKHSHGPEEGGRGLLILQLLSPFLPPSSSEPFSSKMFTQHRVKTIFTNWNKINSFTFLVFIRFISSVMFPHCAVCRWSSCIAELVLPADPVCGSLLLSRSSFLLQPWGMNSQIIRQTCWMGLILTSPSCNWASSQLCPLISNPITSPLTTDLWSDYS